MVASPGHPEFLVWSYTIDFCTRFRTIRDNPT